MTTEYDIESLSAFVPVIILINTFKLWCDHLSCCDNKRRERPIIRILYAFFIFIGLRFLIESQNIRPTLGLKRWSERIKNMNVKKSIFTLRPKISRSNVCPSFIRSVGWPSLEGLPCGWCQDLFSSYFMAYFSLQILHKVLNLIVAYRWDSTVRAQLGMIGRQVLPQSQTVSTDLRCQ